MNEICFSENINCLWGNMELVESQSRFKYLVKF